MIHQNSFGKPTYSTINYLYRADGTKLRKTFSSTPPRGSTSTRITDYLDGFQYSYFEGGGNCITCRTENAYEAEAYRGILDPGVIPEWKLDFVATAEGFYSFTENRYIYQYRDHLGNTRVTFAKNSAGAPEITDTNNYYPFGLNHTGGNGLNSSNFGSFYSYKYNGKELQETGMFDYGWRQYMPDLGRWNGIDQLAESYHMASPYAYVMNNPIFNFDPNGMLSQQFIDSINNSSSGTTWYNTGSGFTSSGGKSMDYDGNSISWNSETTGNLLAGVGAEVGGMHFTVPVNITVSKGTPRTWNDRLNNGIDSFVMYSKFTSALWESRLNYNRSALYYAIEHTKVGQSVSAAENFMFMELPASLAGGELLAAGWRAAGMSRLICGSAGRLTNGLIKICFTEGTLVAVEKGNKKIENIKKGDLVWSYN
ncbi:hypothetical protein LF887_07215 [Chryseobacterium sp. MEBOG06]|uniref:RHS repeat-associated core domain-containing protein n=1 Tax=Chryseobacterium sp. MEBOG06 TaxID=2879938 RepID=UPI001F465DC0|nr:RHS repeat-associated core domain-containing protein [Chryseobacterium sp. MEBOG06]UKB85404.1 hypothetical protein LF887_07215 [Chryseobacterium sp. MEBOG06]